MEIFHIFLTFLLDKIQNKTSWSLNDCAALFSYSLKSALHPTRKSFTLESKHLTATNPTHISQWFCYVRHPRINCVFVHISPAL